MQKIITKKGYEAVIIGEVSVVKKEDRYFVYDNITSGRVAEDQSGIENFATALEEWKDAKIMEQQEKSAAAKLAEEKRLADLRERIAKCETPAELADEFNLSMAELAGHWSELYEGQSRSGILIGNRDEYEIVSVAKDIHGSEGEFGEARHRAGEHHSTFSRMWGGLEDYQVALKRHFAGDGFFYKSQENDAESFLDLIKAADSMDEAAALVKAWEEIEAGYYDCNGNLEMSDKALNDPDIAGYSYDVYSYSFCFDCGRKNSWKEQTEEENG